MFADALQMTGEMLQETDNTGTPQMLIEAADENRDLRNACAAALERLEASLFTNAEHDQAKDVLRGALRGPKA